MKQSRKSSLDFEEIHRVASALADAARQETLRFFRSSELLIDNKAGQTASQNPGFDPVTQADRAAEREMRRILADLRPNDGILGEEMGAQPGSSGLEWVLDPIDGTRAYMSGTASWGVLIALRDAAGPLFGMIDQPYIGERFWGAQGQAWLEFRAERQKLQSRRTQALDQAILFSTFPEIGSPAEREAFERLSRKAKLTRYGLDCYAYALLAAGQIDLVVEAGLQAYDIQAPIALIEAAGGVVTSWDGRPAHEGGRVLAAANKELHDRAMEQLAL